MMNPKISKVCMLGILLSGCVGSAVETQTGASEPKATRTRAPTNTPPQTGPMATAYALGEQTTLVPFTPAGESANVADDDYVGIFEYAWNVVNEKYYSDEFNGLDWDAIHEEYRPLAEEVESSDELWELLEDMIAELDDEHSRFISPHNIPGLSGEAKPSSGVWVFTHNAREYEHALVWCVAPNSPAEKAGIRRGDRILAVDGIELTRGVEGFDEELLADIWTGRGNETVILTIQQGPDEGYINVTIKIGLYGVCNYRSYQMVSDRPRIGYFRLPNFTYGDTDEDLLRVIEILESEAPLDGLIIDVRHNTGGGVEITQDTVKIFAKGLLGTRGALREDAERFLLNVRGPVLWNEETPVVILIDGHTHSAAEYFAAGMQVRGRATIIGMNSNGNTETVTNFIIPGGAQIYLTFSIFALPDGTFLEGVGVRPDIIVPLGDWGLSQAPYDVQLQAAIDHLVELVE